jgi:hypothetical protein
MGDCWDVACITKDRITLDMARTNALICAVP